MRLLKHYDGIERALDYLAEKLLNIIDTPTNYREQHFIEAIVTMPLFYYRAAGNQTTWIPDNETFRQFESRIGNVVIWQAWTPKLSSNDIKNWLYTNLLESGNVRHTA